MEHNPGRGRLEGMMENIRVRTEQGVDILIGSGFSDEDRQYPPAIGRTIIFQH